MATDEFGKRARREIRRQTRRIKKRNAQRAADDAAATTDTPQKTNYNLSQSVKWGNANQFDNDGNPPPRQQFPRFKPTPPEHMH
jgi:hypothetical protein